jgi:hypothetical protein
MKNMGEMRVRVARFLSERYEQRERPSYLADLLLWGVVVMIATWPMVMLAHIMEMGR